MRKRILAFTAAALALSAQAPAFAAQEFSTTITAECELPDVVVTLPSTAQVFINPYKMPVEIDADETTAQVLSTPAAIENESEVPIRVDVSVVGKIKEGSDMTLSTYSTQGNVTTKKKAFLYFEMMATSEDDPERAAWAQEYDADKHLIVRTTSKTKKNMVTLDAADGRNHFGAFRLTGDCTETPKKAWTDTDGVEVEIAFTFTPLGRPGI